MSDFINNILKCILFIYMFTSIYLFIYLLFIYLYLLFIYLFHYNLWLFIHSFFFCIFIQI